MKIITKKARAIIFAALIVTGLAACGGQKDSSAAKVTIENDGPLVPYPEPITITWGVPTRAMQRFLDNDTYDDNRWSRKIKKDLNIDLKVAFSADTSTDAYRNKMNTLLASGDLPDIVSSEDRTFFIQAQRAGYLADITDVFGKYALEGVREHQIKYADSFEGASFDGRLYGFPTMNNNFHQATYLWIRDDWLENTNSQPPKTVSEMVALARKFTFGDPDGNGVNDTYGLAMTKYLIEANYGNILGLISAFGIPVRGRGSPIFYRGADGKITNGIIQPEMKEALALVRDMYDEGLIDPEFIVKDVGNMDADIINGKVGMMYHMNWGDWIPFNNIYEDSGVITRPYPLPVIPGRDFKVGIESNKTGNVFMLNSKYQYPEAFIKILNLYYDTTIGSDDLQSFIDYNELYQYLLCPVLIECALPENYSDILFNAFQQGSGAELPIFLKQYYNYAINFENGTDTSPNAYGTWGQINPRGSMAISLNDYDGHLVSNIMGAIRPETWLQNSSILETMYETTFTDIIRGDKPLDSFDQFVTDWLNAGGQKILDELEALYPVN